MGFDVPEFNIGFREALKDEIRVAIKRFLEKVPQEHREYMLELITDLVMIGYVFIIDNNIAITKRLVNDIKKYARDLVVFFTEYTVTFLGFPHTELVKFLEEGLKDLKKATREIFFVAIVTLTGLAAEVGVPTFRYKLRYEFHRGLISEEEVLEKAQKYVKSAHVFAESFLRFLEKRDPEAYKELEKITKEIFELLLRRERRGFI